MKKKLISILSACVFVFTMTACGGSGENASEGTEVVISENPGTEEAANTIRTETPSTAIYIGIAGQTMREYPCESSDNVTPEMMLSTMSALTGWNLDLADKVKVEDGKITVCFAKTSSLFVAPPEPQVEEFFVYDGDELTRTILDSIQYTLQHNYVNSEAGSDGTYDIYYCMEGGQPLELSLIGKTLPLDEPYNGLDNNADTLETEVISSDANETEEGTE